MTKSLDQAIAKVRTLPADRQDEAAALLMGVVEQDPAKVQLNAAQIAEVEARLAESEPQIALHEDVRAFFHKPTG